MRYYFVIAIFLLVSTSVKSKESSIDSVVVSLQYWRKQVFDEKIESKRIEKNDSLRFYVEMFLNTENTFYHKLDDISFFGDLHSPDETFRFLTWNLPIGDSEFAYFCFLQKSDGSWFELKDGRHYGRRLENKNFRYTDWLGALYYEIIPSGSKKDPYYILLGWDGKNKMSNRKILETMYFDKKGYPRFGKGVLKKGQFTKKRMILEYTEDAYVALRYNADKDIIVFNFLKPLRPELEGIYEFYAPDLTFDAYVSKGKIWEYKDDVDVRSKKSGKEYIDPRNAPKPRVKTQ